MEVGAHSDAHFQLVSQMPSVPGDILCRGKSINERQKAKSLRHRSYLERGSADCLASGI